jgi:hypothetical protein
VILQRKARDGRTTEELASLYLAADEARWLAEEHRLPSYWEVARVLVEALPQELGDTLDYCWAHASVVAQQVEGDRGYYRRLECHTGYLRQEYPQLHEAIVSLVEQVRAARACAA